MNKREVVWLIVRLFGIGFVYLAIVSAFGLIGSISTFTSLPAAPSASTNSNTEMSVTPIAAPDNFPVRQPNLPNRTGEKPAPDAASKKAGDDAVKNLLWYLFLIALYGAAGFYLLRDGRILFAALNREDKIISDTKEINSLGIFDEETK